MIDRDLLARLVSVYPAQPATAFWRAVEIAALAEVGIPQGRGLDLGCGDGKLTDVLLSLTGPRTMVGVDPDPLETRIAVRTGIYECVHTTSGAEIPERSGSIDFVLANSVLEHVSDLELTMAEVCRVLRRDGRFYFTIPTLTFRDNLKGPLLPFTSRASYLEGLDRRLSHLNYMSLQEWDQLCRGCGMLIESCHGYLDDVETRRWELLSRMTGGLMYALAGGKRRPIEIQRRLGARALQSAKSLPLPVARAIADIMVWRLPRQCGQTRWTRLDAASCMLVEGRRT